MGATDGAVGEDGYFRTHRGAMAMGLLSLLVGAGLLVGIVLGSVELIIAALALTLAYVLVSLGIVFKAEGVLTRENAVIGAFVVTAIGLGFGLQAGTDLPQVVSLVVLFVVGIGAPHLVLQWTRLRGR